MPTAALGSTINGMGEIIYKSAIEQTEALLSHYGFDLGEHTAQEIIAQWLNDYQALWIRLAVLEALFQGRYKAISVEQILNFWKKKGNPIFHFNHEYEQLICHRIPRHLRSFTNSQTEVEEEYHGLNSDKNQPVKIVPASQKSPNIQPEKKDEIPEIQDNPASVANILELKTQISTTEKSDRDNQQEQKISAFASVSPIHQFTPDPDNSSFYLKLKAVANQKIEGEEELN